MDKSNEVIGEVDNIKKGGREMLVNSEDELIGKNIKKKPGRKKKEGNEQIQESKEQNKFYIDVSKENENKELIRTLLLQANTKSYGREITLKDLVVFALSKINSKEIEKIQEGSLSSMDKVQRKLDEHNKKNGTSYELGEYLTKVCKIE